jgi:hypothetical protein
MDIMSKIDSKDALLQVLQTATTSELYHLTRIGSLCDDGGVLNEPCTGRLIYEIGQTNELMPSADAPAFDGYDFANNLSVAYNSGSDIDDSDKRSALRIANTLAYMREAMPESAFWVWRENARFVLEYYKPPAFLATLRKIGKDNPHLWWHFPHVSTEDPTMVAYTPSPEYGKRDRQVRTKVGRYLTQFYGETLTQNQIRSLADGVKQLDFHMSKDADDFEAIYSIREDECGLSSCMQGDVYSFDSEIHPARVYASGDFALAWLTDRVLNDRVVARAIVAFPDDPAKAHFVRVYGDESNALHDMLLERDYPKESVYLHSPRLLVVEHDDGQYVMPYIDGGNKFVSMHRIDGKRYWLVANSDGENRSSATNTNGLTERMGGRCEVCGDYTEEDEDDMAYSDYHGIRIGRCCSDQYLWAHSRRGNEDHIESDSCVYCETDGEHYHDQYLDYYDIVYCEHESEYRHIDECVRDPSGEWMSKDNAIEVINNTEGEVYFHESDVDSAVGVVVVAPDTVEGFPYQTIVWGDDMPELFAEAYLNAPRFMDDYGNERVVGFTTLRDLVRSYGDKEGASRAFRYMTNFRTHYFYHATFQALR